MRDKKSDFPCPFVVRPFKPYFSPNSTPDKPILIETREQRREDLKRHNQREVDPSECPPEVKAVFERINEDRTRKRKER